ncbi:MAG: hypothetical protein U1A28_00850 [Patescibacteria group bacterium]|nr:hypothetical protein [Patescibacteria group bacterium]
MAREPIQRMGEEATKPQQHAVVLPTTNEVRRTSRGYAFTTGLPRPCEARNDEEKGVL